MNEALIRTAIDNLLIEKVDLLTARVDCDEVFSFSKPKPDCNVKVGRGLISFSVLEPGKDEESKSKYVAYIYQCGLKFEPKDIKKDASDSDCTTLLIEARFSAVYMMKDDVNEDALREFGRYNVPYHVWPYWREYAQSTLSRMGIEPVPIPVYRFRKSSPE